MTDAMLAGFPDETNAGFFFTTAAHERLLARSKNLLGSGNLPSANAVAVEVLLRLARLVERPAYRQAAVRTLDAYSGAMQQQPQAHEAMLLAVGMCLPAAAAGHEA